jgi:bacterial/archaeal transporter family-2 protein
MGKLIWIVVAFLAGAFLPLQGGLNAVLGKEAKSPMYASMFSFIIGTILIALYVFTTRQTVSWEGVRGAPWYAWLGGLFGAYCLTAIILAFPNLGPGLTFGLLVAGQMIISVALEHFNILVAEPHPISLLRVLGILLVVGGVLMVRVF